MANERMEDYQALAETNARLTKQVEELTAEKKRVQLEKVTKMYRKVSKGFRIAVIAIAGLCAVALFVVYPLYRSVNQHECWYATPEDHNNPWTYYNVCHKEWGKDNCVGRWDSVKKAWDDIRDKKLEECK